MAINFPSTTNQATDGSFTHTDSTAGITWTWDGTSWSAGGVSGGGGSTITIKDEGVALTTAASSLDFVGLGVTASGTTGDKTITISGGGGSSYTDSDVDTHLNTSTASTNEVLTWNGSDYTWGAPAGYTNSDVDTHLNQSTALTGQVLTWNGSDYDWSDEIDIDGTGQFHNLGVSGISTFSGRIFASNNLRVTGLSTFASNVDVNASVDISGGLNVTGIATIGNVKINGNTVENKDVGGSLILASRADIEVKVVDANLNQISALIGNSGGSVDLYHDGIKKFETTGYGVTVTGGVNSTGIGTFKGGVNANGPVTNIQHTSATYQQYEDFTVKVITKTAAHRYNGSGSASGYTINGTEAPFLTLTPGITYRFYQEDSSNVGHPLLFYLEADKTTQYTTNVNAIGNIGSVNGRTEILVTEDTPSVLYYQCSAHDYMGNAVQTNSPVAAKLQTARTIELSGAVSGSTTFDGSGNASINTTSNITLGTDTSGNYVATVAGTTNEIEVTGSGSASAAVTVGLPNSVTITGTMTAGTFSGSGASLTSLPAGQLTGTLPAIDGSNLINLPSGGITVSTAATSTTMYPMFADIASFSSNFNGEPDAVHVSYSKLSFDSQFGNLSAYQFTSLSDRNEKENIRPIENALDITKQLEGVRFDWKENGKPSLGVIAQDLEKVLPELVITGDDGVKRVSYGNIVGVLIEAIKEQQKQIDRQQEMIDKLIEIEG
jgi:hypothetical protein